MMRALSLLLLVTVWQVSGVSVLELTVSADELSVDDTEQGKCVFLHDLRGQCMSLKVTFFMFMERFCDFCNLFFLLPSDRIITLTYVSFYSCFVYLRK